MYYAEKRDDSFQEKEGSGTQKESVREHSSVVQQLVVYMCVCETYK
jgi:hypothetical protein